MASKISLETIEYVRTMIKQETNIYPPCGHMLKDSLPPAVMTTELMDKSWRREMCEWCYEVVDYFGFDREAVSFAFNYIDRTIALQKSQSVSHQLSKREVQLITITCLYIANKIHGNDTSNSRETRQLMSMSTYVALGRGFFDAQVIESMERKILQILDWRVNPPTCTKFIGCFVQLCPQKNPKNNDLIYDVARYLAELSVCEAAFSYTCRNSILAYACIDCAFEALQEQGCLELTDASARTVYLRNIAKVTNIFPEMEEVVRTRQMIKDLCPPMFKSNAQILEEFIITYNKNYGTTDIDASTLSSSTKIPQNSPVSAISSGANVEEHADGSIGGSCSGHKRKRNRSLSCGRVSSSRFNSSPSCHIIGHRSH